MVKGEVGCQLLDQAVLQQAGSTILVDRASRLMRRALKSSMTRRKPCLIQRLTFPIHRTALRSPWRWI